LPDSPVHVLRPSVRASLIVRRRRPIRQLSVTTRDVRARLILPEPEALGNLRGSLATAGRNASDPEGTVAGAKEKRDPSGKWTRVAGDTRMYFDVYTKWYDDEVRRGQTVLADLREGRHLDFVDKMIARATRELGGTVSYDDIIR
jgi:hypothetical protein